MYKISYRSLFETKTDWLNYAARFCLQISFIIGLISIISWIFEFREILNIKSNYVPIAPDTAVIMSIISMVLLFKTFYNNNKKFNILFSIILSFVSLYVLLKIIELLFNTDLTFGKFLFPDNEYIGSFLIKRISPYTSSLFLLSGIAALFILSDKAHLKYHNIISALGAVVLSFGSVLLIGYSFGTPLFYSGKLIPVSLPAAAGITILGIGIVASSGPKSFINRLFIGTSIKVLLMRSFIPVIIIAIFTEGLLHEILVSNVKFNHGLLASGIIVTFILITVLISFKITNKISSVVNKAELERNEAEFRLIENLNEKETLLKELNHRVKNNFNLISSLIELTTHNKENMSDLHAAVDMVKKRINTISLIHKQLYHSKSFAKIDFSNYIVKLTNDLLKAYHSGKKINIVYDMENIHLPITKAIPCGMIINELIINSFKYAFIERNLGNIFISFKNVDGYVELAVNDDGTGLPEKFDPDTSETLGYTIIKELCKQIDGEYEISSNSGTYYKIKFLNN